jgi:hypothetical protein
MRKYNLEFIGEIVFSPSGVSSWEGTTVTFWGKFDENGIKKPYEKFERKRLVEAIPIENDRPSEEYHRCIAFLSIPEEYLFLDPVQVFLEESKKGLTLGELIDTLRSMPPDAQVANLTFPHSYRGYHEDLAFEQKSGTRLASELLSDCESSLNKIFFGYKGGEYGMVRETPVWIADYGDTGDRLNRLNSDGTIETRLTD